MTNEQRSGQGISAFAVMVVMAACVSFSCGGSGGTAASASSGKNRTLSVKKSGRGSGSVVGSGMDCGSTCVLPFQAGGTVSLTATPDQGSSFAGWTGCDDGSAQACSVTMGADREVTATFVTWVVSTVAGMPGHDGSTDGAGTAARFNYPQGVAVDGAGNIYVADSFNYTIRKITPSGEVSTLAGQGGSPGHNGHAGSVDGTGSAARFDDPRGVAVDGAGNVYVADAGNHTIRKITPAGEVSTLAGTARQTGSVDGTGAAARFHAPVGVAVDGLGNVYVADAYNETIRKVTPTGTVSTLAGMALQRGSADGVGATARFNEPSGVAVDGAGNVYVADTGVSYIDLVDGNNFTVRKITPAGEVSTLAGTAQEGGAVDATGSAARFDDPRGVAVDGLGNVYVADTGSATIRKITPAGEVSTLAGMAFQRGGVDGTASAARFRGPVAVAVDASGQVIYVADISDNTIRRIALE